MPPDAMAFANPDNLPPGTMYGPNNAYIVEDDGTGALRVTVGAPSLGGGGAGSTLEYITGATHAALTAASFLPSVVGATFSALDGGLYALQGDYKTAGIAIAAAGIGIVADAGMAKLALAGARSAADAVLLDSRLIRFTQDSVSGTFKDGRTIQEMVDGLTSGLVSLKDVPPIRVFEQAGNLFSLDNRRLLAVKLAGSPINVIRATAQEVESEAWKFTTRNNGCIICLRNGWVNVGR